MKKKKTVNDLDIQYPMSAGIDVGSTLMQVCIPSFLDEDPNRAFGTTTKELNKIVTWLKEKNITHAAMEATGIYWLPLFNLLVRSGIDVKLLNAADVKNYTARKTDVNDAEWLMILMRHGMVKPSFQLDDLCRKIRNYTRHRSTLTSLASDSMRRIQKCMEMMNLKLTETISDITGVSGISIIEAIIGGERNPEVLARMADRCKKSRQEIAAALEGTWDEELIIIMSQHYEQYKLLRRQSTNLDYKIEEAIKELSDKIIQNNDGLVTEVIRSKKPKSSRKSNNVHFDLEYLSTQIYGVNLMRVDGIKGVTVLSLMGELGSDFTKDFKNAAHFCAWCNLAPTDKISGGKLLSSKIKKRKNNVGLILRNCCMSLASHKGPIGDYYRRMRAKGGGKFAVLATAHKLAIIIYTMVNTKAEYDSTKVSITDQEWLKRRIKRQEKLLEQLKKQVC